MILDSSPNKRHTTAYESGKMIDNLLSFYLNDFQLCLGRKDHKIVFQNPIRFDFDMLTIGNEVKQKGAFKRR